MQNGGRGHIKQNNANFATENCGYPQKSFAKQTKSSIFAEENCGYPQKSYAPWS
jgi:hypothetical protein